MAYVRGKEIPTIDVVRVTIKVPGSDDELVLNTASKITIEPQIETQESIKLIIKGVLKAQKPLINTLTGNAITLTDNVFNPQLVLILQGGVIEFDPNDARKLLSYKPPVAGADVDYETLILCTYSAIYNAAGIITGYEKISYPNCKGVPIALSSEDNVFRVSEYTINSAPDTGESPYIIEWVGTTDLPSLPAEPTEISLMSASADGDGSTPSTKISITFDKAITGLAAASFVLAGDTGSATAGALTGTGASYELAITPSTAGTVNLNITSPDGFYVVGVPMAVEVFA